MLPPTCMLLLFWCKIIVKVYILYERMSAGGWYTELCYAIIPALFPYYYATPTSHYEFITCTIFD